MEYVPVEHWVHWGKPEPVVNVPDRQFTQPVPLGEYVPGLHMRQTVAPDPDKYVPTPHAVQVDEESMLAPVE